MSGLTPTIRTLEKDCPRVAPSCQVLDTEGWLAQPESNAAQSSSPQRTDADAGKLDRT
jgi:hypothetical protein